MERRRKRKRPRVTSEDHCGVATSLWRKAKASLLEVDRTADRFSAELRGQLVDRLAEALAAVVRAVIEAELARGVARFEIGCGDAAQAGAQALARLERHAVEQIDGGACEDA